MTTGRTLRTQFFGADAEHAFRGVIAGLLSGVLTSAVGTSLALAFFTGPLEPHLPAAIGAILASTIVLALAGALFSAIPAVMVAQEIPIAALGIVLSSLIAAGLTPAETLPTAIAAGMLAALLTGALFLVAGQLRLSRYLRFLPLPVMGGYLAGLGWLLFSAGFGTIMGIGPSLDALPLLADPILASQLAIAAGFAAAIHAIQRISSSRIAAPLAIIAGFALFHLVIALAGIPREDLVASGWMLAGIDSSGPLWPPLLPQDFAQVRWDVIAWQAPALLAIPLVSAVALIINLNGIELLAGRDADLDRELRVAGLGSLLAALAMGVPGFQSTTHTALSFRFDAALRSVGVVIALVCTSLLVLGGDLLALLPAPLCAGLLFWLAINFIDTWIIQAFRKYSPLEFALTLGTVLVIALSGFLNGVLFGLVGAVILFVASYSRLRVIGQVLSGRDYHSGVGSRPPYRPILVAHGEEILVLRLSGFLFFGSATQLRQQVQHLLRGKDGRIRHLILDFRQVTGVDASAIQSFSRLFAAVDGAGVQVTLTKIAPEHLARFARSGLPLEGAHVAVIPEFDDALRAAEFEVIGRHAPHVLAHGEAVLHTHLEALLGSGHLAEAIEPHFQRVVLKANETIIDQGAREDDIFIIVSGTARVEARGPDGRRIRLTTLGPGAIIGELSYYLKAPRTASVVAETEVEAWQLSAEKLDWLDAERPQIAIILHRGMARMLAERVSATSRLVQILAG
ncbi:cyclic nucleotide-binding domain-containing protein [Arsenicitalea aurantiaca]|uniref:Cyclic nucleotide-binding domain-containing protein n=1 Tax=Arsenicitalea aurantiaca TaxID=1783274 RepID=A0A433XBA6_9HYPH|nr:cyclic nucleotide-binding domain-containing protein [Arsenicitalea aurantiaca]RUT31343.1 cyclic nucleotide-binding domain-containing protein [Arsenicitalea aurantiaca]